MCTDVIPGLVPGSELAWTDFGWSAPARTTGVDHFTKCPYLRKETLLTSARAFGVPVVAIVICVE